jgi:hypothetical protein
VRPRRVASGVALLGLLLTGCGGDEQPATPERRATKTTEEVLYAPLVKLYLREPERAQAPPVGRRILLRAEAEGGTLPRPYEIVLLRRPLGGGREVRVTAKKTDKAAHFRVTAGRAYEYVARIGKVRSDSLQVVGVLKRKTEAFRTGPTSAEGVLTVRGPRDVRGSPAALLHFYVAAGGGGTLRRVAKGRLKTVRPGLVEGRFPFTLPMLRASDRFYVCSREAFVRGYGDPAERDVECGERRLDADGRL